MATNAYQAEVKDMEGCKLFVGQVPRGSDDAKLRGVFGVYGTVTDVYLLTDKMTQNFKGCAFVTMSTPEEAQAAIAGVEQAETTMEGAKRSLIVKMAGPSGQKTAEPTEHKLYVGMLSRETTEEEVKAMFEPYGEILETFMLTDKATGQSKGIAFVKYARRDEALRAINALDEKFQDKQAPANIQVRFAQTAQEKDLKKQQQVPPGANPWGAYGMQMPGYDATRMMPGLGMGAGMGGMGGGMGGMGMGGMGMGGMGAMGGAGGAVGSTQQGPQGANLFVLGLPEYTADTDLASMFSSFGTVLSAKVQMNLQTQRSKGFGFVSFDNPQSAQSAIASMDGCMMGGKRVQVRVKQAGAGSKSATTGANRFRPY